MYLSSFKKFVAVRWRQRTGLQVESARTYVPTQNDTLVPDSIPLIVSQSAVKGFPFGFRAKSIKKLQV